MMRVATFSQSAQMTTMALNNQAKVSEASVQVATGYKTQMLADLGGADVIRTIDLTAALAASEARQSVLEQELNRVEVMHSTASAMIDLLSQIRTSISAAMDGNVSEAEFLKTEAEGVLEDMVGLMNTTFEGRSLFAGTATNIEPVDISALAVPTIPSTADTSYYTGNDDVMSVTLGTGATVDYGVTADNPAFEEAIRALNILANLTTSPADTVAMSEAYDLATGAIDGMTAVQGGMSLAAERIEEDLYRESNVAAMAETTLADLTAVDVAQATVELEHYQTLLEASYSAIAKVSSLSLADYL